MKKTVVFIKIILSLIMIWFLYHGFISDNYNYPEIKVFSGEYLYNPYKNFKSWSKTNFHTHSKAWLGLTNGKQSQQEVLKKYKELDYDFATISNYHKISNNYDIYPQLNVYEHGHNILKIHFILIGAKKVLYSDNPFAYSLDDKQNVISSLKNNCEILVIAHPKLRSAFNNNDIKSLSGYDCIEVFNHYVESTSLWDAALSSGIPAWIIANDDSHNCDNSTETGVYWTMINSSSNNVDTLLLNLKDGNAYGVKGHLAQNKNFLDSLITNENKVNLFLQNIADSIILVGQNGEVKQRYFDTNKAEYIFKKDDTYIRAEIYNENSKIFLNPVIRTDGTKPTNTIINAKVNYFYTYSKRFIILIFLIILYHKILIKVFTYITNKFRYPYPYEKRTKQFLDYIKRY